MNNILLDKKLYEKILIYDVSYKTLIGAKPLSIIFNKVDGLIRDHDGTKHLVLFDPKQYDANSNWIGYFIGL